MRKVSYVLGIKLLRNMKQRTLDLSQDLYVDKISSKFGMDYCERALIPFMHGLTFSCRMYPATQEEEETMSRILYASAVGSLIYTMLCT